MWSNIAGWDYLQSMKDAWNVTEDGEQDIDQKLTTAATLGATPRGGRKMAMSISQISLKEITQ
jgi:hypothetical protein